MLVLLLKATGYKTSLIMLKRTIRASLNLINPLARDGMNMRRKRNKIPCATLKSNDLLGHRMLSLWMTNGITITIMVCRLERPTILKFITRGQLSRKILNRR
jgi:hypothetical protein